MAQSIREQSVDKIISNISAGISMSVFRSPYEALARETKEACVVDWVKQRVNELTSQLDDNTLLINVSVLSRSPTAEKAADEHMVAIHLLIMADRLLGGLSQNVHLEGAGKQRDEMDTKLCTITHQYRVEFRTSQGDISQ